VGQGGAHRQHQAGVIGRNGRSMVTGAGRNAAALRATEQGIAMRLPRKFLALAAGAALFGLSAIANAQDYPVRPVRIVVGFAAGGPTDVLARLTGGTIVTSSPAEFGKLIAEETDKWGRVVKFSGAKPD